MRCQFTDQLYILVVIGGIMKFSVTSISVLLCGLIFSGCSTMHSQREPSSIENGSNSSIQTMLKAYVTCSNVYSEVRGGSLERGAATWAQSTRLKVTPIDATNAVATSVSNDGKDRLQLTFSAPTGQDVEVNLQYDLDRNGKHYTSNAVTELSEHTLQKLAEKYDGNFDTIILGTVIYGAVPKGIEWKDDYGTSIVRKLHLKDGEFEYLSIKCGIDNLE
jgi:hypothetical protein